MAAVSLESLDRKQAALDRLLAVHVAKANGAIRSRIADAKAHALVTLTPTMKDRTAGRPTLAALRRHRSFQAALWRLSDLTEDLRGIVAEAREEFAAAAWKHWRRVLPDLASSKESAPAGLIQQARSMVLYGYTTHAYVNNAVGRAKDRLLPALELAARAGVSKTGSKQAVQVWGRTETAHLETSVLLLLRTSLTAIDRMAGRAVLPPELLDEDQDSPYG